jgi:Icc-related predicted phosphoesterase
MIVAVSDLHGFLPEVPACDLLIVAGDVTPLWDHSLDFQFGWLDTKFRQWLEEANAGSIVGIAGNHDFIFEKGDEVDTLELPWAYLLDSSYMHLGVKYYGLPWIPKLQSWAFYADDLRLDQKFKAIPDDTDVIISHGPPKGFCDRNLAYHPCGSLAATYAMRRVEPKAFICGHIHEAFGSRQDGPTTVYNVSYVDVDYQPQDRFTVIDLLESPDDALSEPGS